MYKVETHYLDIGQGDCSVIIVRRKDNKQIVRVVVYDCGSDGGEFAAQKLLEKCHLLGVTEIHVAIISHFDEDHFNGFTRLFQMGSEMNDPNFDRVKSLFRNTKLYTQGCIFKKFFEASIGTIESTTFLSAYYFQTARIEYSTSILGPYTNFLNAISSFKIVLNAEDEEHEKDDNFTHNTFEHLTERHLAGFPTDSWKPSVYPPGEYLVFGWSPTKIVANEVANNHLVNVNFESGSTLLGKDLMNMGFDDDLRETVSLNCIAVNHQIYTPHDALSATPKPKKNGNVANNMSLTCLLIYENYAAFFGGDLETHLEEELIPTIKHLTSGGGLTVLKAGHHGAATSTSSTFLDMLTPKLVIITCGEQNSHGHPAIALIERLYESTSIDQTIIAGFGVRLGNIEEEQKKKNPKNRRTQEQLDEDFQARISEYRKFDVPVNSTDIFLPESKFVLAGTFDSDQDGSIVLNCFRDDDGLISVRPVFQHVFTHMRLLNRKMSRTLSREHSQNILAGKRKRAQYEVFEDQDESYLMLKNEGKTDSVRTFRVEICGDKVNLKVKKRRIEKS